MSDGGSDPTGRRERLRKAWAYFGLWREFRPFWGGTLLLLAGLAMGFIPVVAAGILPFAVGSFTGSALLFAVLLMLCGLSALTFPRVSSVVGLAGMLVSVLSVFGALGGYLVGSFLGGVGGLLAFAWRPPTVAEIEAEYGTVDDVSVDDADDGETGASGDDVGAANAVDAAEE
ncbi:DUF6114 domain-containing protein [Halorientalis marina]|uniref:DUF6114 domain-containing protein n=1 Tax=Halorientalis marina TaxID=2931976 RepID=UPI001FF36BF0|nr:DUF6114 domain-containing protein [Halorientalis marina]